MGGHVETETLSITISGKMVAHLEHGGQGKQGQRLAEWIGTRSYQTITQAKFLVL